jgi:PIN domain nuclease of toxin-antitoxin system
LNLLLDTHLLLWAAGAPDRLGGAVRGLIEDRGNRLWFSAASIWEVSIKRALGRSDFQADPRLLRRGLIDNGYEELVIDSEHAAAVDALPVLHKDPFDRILIAQAAVEGFVLLTHDPVVARYPGSICLV